MNGLCSYIYDHITNDSNEQLHLGGQAMYNYVENNGFKENFKELLDLAASNENITEKMLTSGFGVIPVQFYRFIGYDDVLLQNIELLFGLDSEGKNLIQQKAHTFKTYQDPKHEEVIKVAQAIKTNKEKRAKLIDLISCHDEIATIPNQTKRD